MELLKGILKRFALPIAINIVVVAVIFPALAFVEPLVQKRLFDVSLYYRDFKGFVLVFALFVLLSIAGVVLEYLYTLFYTRFENGLRYHILGKFLRHYYLLPYEDILKSGPGYYLSRIYEEPQEVVISTLSLMFRLISAVVSSAARLIAMFLLSPIATLVVIPLALLSFIITRRFGGRIGEVSRERMEREARLRSSLTDALKSYVFVKVFNLVEWATGHVLKNALGFLNTLYDFQKVREGYVLINRLGSMSVQVAFIGLNVYLLLLGKITVGDFFGFMAAFYPFYSALGSIIEGIPQVLSRRAQLERVESLLNVVPEDGDGSGEGIRLEDVSFSYGDRRVLEGVSLTVRKGERVLVVGPNGSGKSTLLLIMAGLLKPERGRVSRCRKVSLMPNYVPDVPVGEYLNLDVFNREVLANLLKRFRIAMDKRPSQLSAGQFKKFIVALTLSRDASCYLLDEPFENVDTESIPDVAEAVLSLTEGKALVVVMHGNEEVWRRFDRILEIKGGKAYDISDRLNRQRQGD